MNLQTNIPLTKRSSNLIDYKSKILLLGSCFVENIGEKLEYFKFQNLVNPFGVLFHPKALETLISRALISDFYSEEDVFFHNEQWYCFDAHSKLSNASKADLLNDLNNQIDITNQQIKTSTHIIITLGTSWVYHYSETNTIVANCHKVPQKQFKKELLSVDEITASLKNILSLINNVNHNVQVLFTVSPVRHLKDGFVENTQSKAHLISAVHQVLLDIGGQSLSTSLKRGSVGASYFPSYEIMMDELRDYRFYREDMLHPNETAINYIWEKFIEVWLSNETQKTMKEVESIQKGLTHKPFNSNSEAHLKFLNNLEEKKAVLKSRFPNMRF